MNTAAWHRNTSLLLLSLSVDHVLGHDTDEDLSKNVRDKASASLRSLPARANYRASQRSRKVPARPTARAFAQGD